MSHLRPSEVEALADNVLEVVLCFSAARPKNIELALLGIRAQVAGNDDQVGVSSD